MTPKLPDTNHISENISTTFKKVEPAIPAQLIHFALQPVLSNPQNNLLFPQRMNDEHIERDRDEAPSPTESVKGEDEPNYRLLIVANRLPITIKKQPDVNP